MKDFVWCNQKKKAPEEPHLEERYIVTKGNDTFEVGDHIIFLRDGCVLDVEAGGWIEKEDREAAINGIEVELDRKYLLKEQNKISKRLGIIQELLSEY